MRRKKGIIIAIVMVAVILWAIATFAFVLKVTDIYMSNYKNDDFEGAAFNDGAFVAKKPVIYLYGYDGEVNIKVDADITHSYPNYTDIGWTVSASPNGILTDKDGKEYHYLFWEGIVNHDWDMSKGFCVKGENTAEFLEEKLSILGLNDKEKDDFITYWLPELEQNTYNVISFQTSDYDNIVPMTITPNPDSQLRVLMTWYSSEKSVDINEQTLPTFKRYGKTIVEWGGIRLYEEERRQICK